MVQSDIKQRLERTSGWVKKVWTGDHSVTTRDGINTETSTRNRNQPNQVKKREILTRSPIKTPTFLLCNSLGLSGIICGSLEFLQILLNAVSFYATRVRAFVFYYVNTKFKPSTHQELHYLIFCFSFQSLATSFGHTSRSSLLVTLVCITGM